MAQGEFGPGFDGLERQAQLMAGLAVGTRSLDSRVPMWRTRQPPAPAGNAQTPFPPWNLLPAVQACPPPASAASTDPCNPSPNLELEIQSTAHWSSLPKVGDPLGQQGGPQSSQALQAKFSLKPQSCCRPAI